MSAFFPAKAWSPNEIFPSHGIVLYQSISTPEDASFFCACVNEEARISDFVKLDTSFRPIDFGCDLRDRIFEVGDVPAFSYIENSTNAVINFDLNVHHNYLREICYSGLLEQHPFARLEISTQLNIEEVEISSVESAVSQVSNVSMNLASKWVASGVMSESARIHAKQYLSSLQSLDFIEYSHIESEFIFCSNALKNYVTKKIGGYETVFIEIDDISHSQSLPEFYLIEKKSLESIISSDVLYSSLINLKSRGVKFVQISVITDGAIGSIISSPELIDARNFLINYHVNLGIQFNLSDIVDSVIKSIKSKEASVS